MNNRIYDLGNYIFAASEVLLFDANIWVYILLTPTKYTQGWNKNYSKTLNSIIKAKASIVTNPIVLSEFINTYCRNIYNAKYKTAYSSFKKFRNSPDFKPIAKDAAAYASDILKCCNNTSEKVAISNLSNLLNDFSNGLVDFNDGILVDACLQNGWKLVTHDGDFIHGNIDVLTINQTVLKPPYLHHQTLII